jgi:hypothetical protein
VIDPPTLGDRQENIPHNFAIFYQPIAGAPPQQ